jgi:uncharacterized protein YyaL (SSP411 family)
MHTNRLAREKSPYLLQHQHNPVDWYPWGEEAFAAAKKADKPIFLSIGYSSCYWCHVMEQDSFENEDIARLLNEHFISIKVDREERPDVDSIYMNAVTSMTGQGGWPLSVFLTPERQPFFGGTFFPKAQFSSLLGKINDTWTSQRTALIHSAEQMSAALQQSASAQIPPEELNNSIFSAALQQLDSSFDPDDGGFGRAPKFPPSASLRLLLRIAKRGGSSNARQMVVETLEKMARGGIFDHLGGGFHRYSTDSHWLVPHFEKMLYDNALLSAAYLEAYQFTNEPMFASVAAETLDYVLRDMHSPEGGFYSAEDAGEVGKEGAFYVWDEAELKRLLSSDEFAEIKQLYGVSTLGNFEHKCNILNLQAEHDWDEKQHVPAAAALQKMKAARQQRPRPHRDDKILTSWNGLMISALSKGYQTLGSAEYLRAAQQAATFLRSHLFSDGRLFRRYREQEAKFSAYLDDYAFVIQSLLDLYESDFDEQWLRWAIELQQTLDKDYWDKAGGGYYFASADDPSLIARQKNFTDGAEPSGNAVAALNLLRLADFTLDRRYGERAQKIFSAASGMLRHYPQACATLASALDYSLDRAKEIVIIGDAGSEPAQELLRHLRGGFFPNKVVALGKGAELDDSSALAIFRGKKLLAGKTGLYVCEAGTCKLPTDSWHKALELVSEAGNYSLTK